jgi:dihydrodipicolinate synthase/N-acetylneuraminate lyase
MGFHGIIPAITTPFGADDHIDHEGLARNVDYVADAT